MCKLKLIHHIAVEQGPGLHFDFVELDIVFFTQLTYLLQPNVEPFRCRRTSVHIERDLAREAIQLAGKLLASVLRMRPASRSIHF